MKDCGRWQITMREAAINGYPEKSAHVRASELTNPETSARVPSDPRVSAGA